MRPKLTATAKSIAVLLLALVAIHPLLQPTLPWSDDGQLHLWRVVELDHCLRNGYLYPRWMPDMAYGYGFPLLNYYAPLSVYLAEGFHLLGLDFTTALLAALSTSLALGTLGAYLWTRDAFGEAGGLIAAAAYAYAPYTLYDTIWRGNLAESLALAVLPWAFWRLRRLIQYRSHRDLALAALAFAILVLSHNVTALVASPLLAGYGLLIWLSTERSRKTLGLLAGALALGLALSAFFWMPAFFERALVQTRKMVTTSHFDYRHNFLSLGELLSPPVPADAALMNPVVPRSLGWPALALAVLGAAGCGRTGKLKDRKIGRLRWEIPAMLVGLLLCAFLALPVSRFLWERVPLLPYAGFPWRFLGPAGLTAAWLAGASVGWGQRWQPSMRALGVGLATLALVTFSLTWLYPRYLAPAENLTPAGLIAFERKSGALGTTSVGEYLPVAVHELPDTTALEAQYQAGSPIRRLSAESLPAGSTIVSEKWRLIGGDVSVDSSHDWTATLHLFFFPGWRVWLNGQEVETMPTLPHGLLHFPVPAGETDIKVRFGPTPWRLTGTAISVAGLIASAVLTIGLAQTHPISVRRFAPPRPAMDSLPVWVAALLAVGLAFFVKVRYLDTHDSPVQHAGFDGQAIAGVGRLVQVRFDGGIRLLGHDPTVLTVEGGATLPLHLYWTADAALATEYSSFLHLVDDEGHRWGQSDNQHPGGYPTVRWRPGEYNRDAHTLRVLPGTPPGDYTLRAGLIVRTTGAGLDVLDERGAPAGTSAVIGTVTVTRPQQPPPVEALDMPHRLDVLLGDLTLLGMGLDRQHAAPGETLLLTLYWRAERALPQDYSISVQALNTNGGIVSATVLPLAANIYPASQWIAGEIVQGQHWLTLPANLDSGAYTLRLELLESSRRPVGEPVSFGETGQVTVVSPERHMSIPSMEYRLNTNFGARATLLGYDLEPETSRPGETLRLTLYWRAERVMTRSYAVFTHLLDAESHVVAQHDGLPVEWSRPTTGWLPGEVIADVHFLDLKADVPPGEYLLEVGLYNAETNVRLPVLDMAGQIVEDRTLLAPVSVEP
jgi:hypothetical protein